MPKPEWEKPLGLLSKIIYGYPTTVYAFNQASFSDNCQKITELNVLRFSPNIGFSGIVDRT